MNKNAQHFCKSITITPDGPDECKHLAHLVV